MVANDGDVTALAGAMDLNDDSVLGIAMGTSQAGGYVDGGTLAALTAKGWNVFDVLQNNDAYHALQAVDGLMITGATGTNVNDVAVVLIGEEQHEDH